MYEDLFEKLHKYVKENVGQHRYEHTLGVVETATRYAEKFGADVDKARIAAIFHDACKSEGPLQHGPAAAKLIKEKFGVDDEDIINAIKYHTVGRANMSILERILLFVAGVLMIDPGMMTDIVGLIIFSILAVWQKKRKKKF